METNEYPLEVHAWVCQHITFVDVKPDADLGTLKIGLKTRRYINIHSDAAHKTDLQNGAHGSTGDSKANALALTMLDKVKILESKGHGLDQQAVVALEDAVKGLDLQLERYTREILELDEVKPKKTDRDYAEVIARRNKEIARVNAVSDALDKAKAACETAKAALQVSVVVL